MKPEVIQKHLEKIGDSLLPGQSKHVDILGHGRMKVSRGHGMELIIEKVGEFSGAIPKRKALIFTHPPDYAAAKIATQAWERLGVEVTWALEPHHVPTEGQRHLFTKAPRGGNLNGFAFCEELLELMAGFDFKADSDTLPFSLKWSEIETPLVGFTGGQGRDMYGCAWRMKREAAPLFLAALRNNPKIGEAHGWAEDLTIGALGKIIGRHLHEYNPEGCPLGGWQWKGVLPEKEFRRRFQVINVQRTGGKSREEVAEKMRALLNVGKPERPASDRPASEWGPKAWKRLHSSALALKTPEERLAFLEGFARSIPCGKCKKHWLEILEHLPPDTSTAAGFFAWSVEAHNEVSASIGNASMSLEEARRLYSLSGFFGRVVVISLSRRADRRERLRKHLAEIAWPFKGPEIFDAVDASKLPVPVGWTAGGGAWGCMQSHRQVIERALMDGVDSLLVLEDDVFFVDGFAQKVAEFLQSVPDDWGQLMLGGQYVNRDGALFRETIAPGVERVSGCERTHAYAVRGQFMRELYSKWCAAAGHCDHVMGPFQKGKKVYAPTEFLAGQAEGKSDISGANNPEKLWVAPPKEWPVTLFVGSPEQAREYREKNRKHSGHNLRGEVDVGLSSLMEKPDGERAGLLRKWVDMIEWEGRSKTPERQAMIYGIPEELARNVIGGRLEVVNAGEPCGACGKEAPKTEIATGDLFRGRLAACESCEHRVPPAGTKGATCGIDGMHTKGKAMMARGYCPAGKWGETPSRKEETPAVFWHVAAMHHWKEIVAEQLELFSTSGLLSIRCTFLGSGADLQWLQASASAAGIMLAIEQSDPNLLHYETLAMLAIERWAKTAPAGIPVLYLHTKGASAPGHDGKRRWRHLMQDELVRKWRDHAPSLSAHDAIGCNWRGDHFSGNFWLSRSDYIRSLPDFAAYHSQGAFRRFSCEFWIGQRNPRIISLAHRNADYCSREFFG